MCSDRDQSLSKGANSPRTPGCSYHLLHHQSGRLWPGSLIWTKVCNFVYTDSHKHSIQKKLKCNSVVDIGIIHFVKILNMNMKNTKGIYFLPPKGEITYFRFFNWWCNAFYRIHLISVCQWVTRSVSAFIVHHWLVTRQRHVCSQTIYHVLFSVKIRPFWKTTFWR